MTSRYCYKSCGQYPGHAYSIAGALVIVKCAGGRKWQRIGRGAGTNKAVRPMAKCMQIIINRAWHYHTATFECRTQRAKMPHEKKAHTQTHTHKQMSAECGTERREAQYRIKSVAGKCWLNDTAQNRSKFLMFRTRLYKITLDILKRLFRFFFAYLLRFVLFCKWQKKKKFYRKPQKRNTATAASSEKNSSNPLIVVSCALVHYYPHTHTHKHKHCPHVSWTECRIKYTDTLIKP